jgi:hypothetical protein
MVLKISQHIDVSARKGGTPAAAVGIHLPVFAQQCLFLALGPNPAIGRS